MSKFSTTQHSRVILLRSVAWLLAILIAAELTPRSIVASSDVFPVSIRIDAGETLGELRPIWRFFGADEPNYAYMPNGKKLLAELGRLRPQAVYFRAHNLLNTGDGTPALKWGSTGVYGEDTRGDPVYDDVLGPAADVEVVLDSLPLRVGSARFQHFRVDADHSNAFTVWQRMGLPQTPTKGQYVELENAGQLAQLGAAENVRVKNGTTSLRLDLPRQAVSLLVWDWVREGASARE